MFIDTTTAGAVLPVIDRAYGVIDGSTVWADCLDALLDLCQFDRCALYDVDRYRCSTDLIAMRIKGGRRDPWQTATVEAAHELIVSVLPTIPPGELWLDRDLGQMLDGERQSLESPDGPGFGCAVLDRNATRLVYLEFFTKPQRDCYQDDDSLLQHLLPHLCRAWQLQCRLGTPSKPTVPHQASLEHEPVVHDLRASDLPLEAGLRQQFRLTKAEARVATLIANGLALKQIADRLHVSIHTVRSQLQAIYQKTETCRQAELASLVLRLGPVPAILPGTDHHHAVMFER